MSNYKSKKKKSQQTLNKEDHYFLIYVNKQSQNKTTTEFIHKLKKMSR